MTDTFAALPEADRARAAEWTEVIWAEIEQYPALRACRNFSQLHDVCDANCLGGMCEDEHPIWTDPAYAEGPDGGMNQRALDLINAVQGAVGDRLAARERS